MAERTHYSVGAYSEEQIGAVTLQALAKKVGFMTYDPGEYQLPDGTKLLVPQGKTAVVLLTSDLGIVSGFWDGFVLEN